MMTRTFGKLMASAALVGTMVVVPQTATFAAPAPTLHNDNATAKAGDWYHGAIPPNVDYSKPVILFVQGLHSDYTTWYNTTDSYYDAAYNAGYRTAFVQLKDADGGGGNPATNGPMLASVIQKVKNYYGVAKINIIAHSKGGIDTQAALVNYGAYPYVNLVHQLSTPNKGSELADLSYGDWTWWLGAIMGQQDDAVYSLQTSVMANFRSVVDAKSTNSYTRTYMSGGTGDDGIFSATYYSRAFLPGEDDGAVAIYSAFGNPKGVSSFTDNGSERLSHTKMRYASKTWWQVRPKLTTANFAAAPTANTIASKNGLLAADSVNESSNVIMRGGVVNGTVSDSFTLESGLDGLHFDVMTSNAATQVTLVSPSGKSYKAEKATKGDAEGILFAKASHNIFAVNKPEQGEWKVVVEGANDAYFAMASLAGGAKATVKANDKVLNQNAKTVDVSIALDGAKIKADKVSKAKLSKASKSGKVEKLATADVRNDAAGNLLASIAAPSEAGVYNLSFDVVGVNEKGETVTRSVNYNFAVTDENGNL